jgi:hypothetical protein
MGITSLFKLSKLTIRAYKTEKRQGADLLKRFEVQYNPETLLIHHETEFQRAVRRSHSRYTHTRAKTLDVDLIFDGTQVEHWGVELLRPQTTVAERVKNFLRTCYVRHGETHEPAHLTLSWDKGLFAGAGYDCRLKSVDIQYTAFNRDGSPLHAELKAQFEESIDEKKKAAQDRLASPDLTHTRTVLAGDTLPQLCIAIYGSAAHYLRVAEVNGLDDFRVLSPGQELIFPPYERPAD